MFALSTRRCLYAAATPILVAALSVPLLAKEPGIPRGEKVFNWIDKDKDGKIQLSEIEPRSVKRFMKLDQNADNQVSKAEIEAWLQARLERRRDRILERIDANRDGLITREELSQHIKERFNEADADHNGGVTIEEARAYHVAKRKAFWAKVRADRKAEKLKQ